MTIQEAIQSGKDFKAVNADDYFWMRVYENFIVYVDEVLAETIKRPVITTHFILDEYEVRP